MSKWNACLVTTVNYRTFLWHQNWAKRRSGANACRVKLKQDSSWQKIQANASRNYLAIELHLFIPDADRPMWKRLIPTQHTLRVEIIPRVAVGQQTVDLLLEHLQTAIVQVVLVAVRPALDGLTAPKQVVCKKQSPKVHCNETRTKRNNEVQAETKFTFLALRSRWFWIFFHPS